MKVKIIDNFFDQSDYLQILADSNIDWTINKRNTIYKNLTKDFYTKKCVETISNKLNKPVKLYRAYSHAFHANQKSGIHEDVNATHTALFFVNNIYDENWMGGTVIWDSKPQYVQFKPNRMVIFEAQLLHTGTMFANTDDYRIQCIWKINVL